MKAHTKKLLQAIGLIIGTIGVLIAVVGLFMSLTR